MSVCENMILIWFCFGCVKFSYDTIWLTIFWLFLAERSLELKVKIPEYDWQGDFIIMLAWK